MSTNYVSSHPDSDVEQELQTLRQRVVQLEQEVNTLQQLNLIFQPPQTSQLKTAIDPSLESEVLTASRERLRADYQSWLLRNVIDASSQWIFVKDQRFRYLLVNQSYANAVGKSVDEMLGKDDLELGFPEELVLGNPIKGIRGFREDDKAALAGETLHNPYDPCTVADGVVRIFDTQKIPLRDATGAVFGVLGMAMDVTERKQIEQALEASEAKFRQLVEDAADMIWTCTLEGKLTYLSPQFQVMFGYDPDKWLKQPFAPLVHPEDLPQAVSFLNSLLARGERGEGIEFRHRCQDGSWCWVNTNASLLKDINGTVIGFQGIMRDIHDRKQAEAQLQEKTEMLEQTLAELNRTQLQMVQSEKMSSLGQMVAGVAHEINNPVNFIHGNLDPINEYVQDLVNLINLYQQSYPHPEVAIQTAIQAIDLEFLIEDANKILQSMRLGTNRIREIVLSLRNFSRLDEAEVKQVNIHDGIDSTLTILHHRLKARVDRPEIHVAKHYGHLPLIECCAGQLNQVFMNIFSNAIDALEEWHQQRSDTDLAERSDIISIHTEVRQPNWIRITISDNGPGIQDSIQPRLFDPFFTTKAVGKGTGLGLSISYQVITEKHRGKLWCESKSGKGTTFIIELPCG